MATMIRTYAALARLVVEIPLRDECGELLNDLIRLLILCSLTFFLQHAGQQTEHGAERTQPGLR